MIRTLPLHKDVSITLNASGNGTVSLSPGRNDTTWHLDGATVGVTTHVKEAKAQLSSFPRALPGTLSGSSGDSTDLNYDLSGSQTISCTWTGGDVGAVATFTIYGTQTIQGG